MRSKEVDAHDEDDSAATEIAVTTAIAAVLAHPPDVRTMTAERAELIMESAVGLSLRFYAQRVLQAFMVDWTGSSIPSLPPIIPVDDDYLRTAEEAVAHGVQHAIDDTGESVRELVRAHSGPITIEEGLSTEAQAYQRLVTGMEGIGRILVTRTREEAKDDFARKQGAIGKAWRTRRDQRVRLTHADLEGDFVPLDESFVTVAGNTLRRPGDPQAPLSETINCRCRLSYRMPVPIGVPA